MLSQLKVCIVWEQELDPNHNLTSPDFSCRLSLIYFGKGIEWNLFTSTSFEKQF